MALGRNWARDRYWHSIDPGISGDVGGGVFEGLLAQAYGMDLKKQQGLKKTYDMDQRASSLFKKLQEEEGVTVGDLGGYDNSKSDNTVQDLLSRYKSYETKKEKTAKTERLAELREVQDISSKSNEKMQTERLLVDKLNRAQDRAVRLEELEASDLRAQQQWARQMEYEDKKDAASKEEKALEALVAGLASIGAGFA